MLGSPATRWWSTITSRPKAGVLEEGASGTADASQSAEIVAMSRARMTRASRPLDALPLVSMAASFANSEELSVASSRAFTQRWPHAGRNRTVPERNNIIRTRIVFSPSWFRKGWSLHNEDYPSALQAIKIEANLLSVTCLVEDFAVKLGGLGLADFIQYFWPRFGEVFHAVGFLSIRT